MLKYDFLGYLRKHQISRKNCFVCIRFVQISDEFGQRFNSASGRTGLVTVIYHFLV